MAGRTTPAAVGTRVPWLAVGVFAAASVVLSWLVALPLWLGGQGLADPLTPLVAAAMMFTPALATIPALLVERRARGARAVLRRLGMWPLRPLGRTLGWSAAMIFVMPLLAAAALVVCAVTGIARFDLLGFSGFMDMLRTTLPAGTELPPAALIVTLQLVAIPIGALLNIPFAFGEEVGWRGWLLPALRPLGVWPALLLSGALWGFWHAPLILLGYNFGEPNPLGLAMMVVGSMLIGVIIGWTRLHTGSVWPAVLAHGAFNASAGMGALFLAAGEVPPPTLAGPIGVAMWLVCAVVIAVMVACGAFRPAAVSGELGPDPAPRAALSA